MLFFPLGDVMISILRSLWQVLLHTFEPRATVQYPDEKPYLPPRWRGRIVLRRDPEFFRINFSRCIFCGFCEEACPTYAIQLTPDFEMGEYRRQNLVYEKEDLLINGPGKYPGYNFYMVAGLAIGGKDKGEAENEKPPVDVRSLMP